jgi:hypothetical protein
MADAQSAAAWCPSRATYDAEGRLHSYDGLPAWEHFSDYGSKQWFWHGLLHRDGGLPACVHNSCGIEEWWVFGQRHRDGDLPAYVCPDNLTSWWRHGKRHREDDLPAVIHAQLDGREQEWWVDGVRQTSADRAHTQRQLARWTPLRAAFVGAVATLASKNVNNANT